MALAAGTRLGPYEIGAPIGKGGMGEVYRARDTKLDREVAIKVLPEEFAKDEERLARFEREAKLLASLNHPNIASIYGLEESEGVKALVLELVEGPTLAERIEGGRIPVEEAIAIAKQIAEALEAGHETGVIHRDLKPANIKLKEDGTVKVLDYGLAKALEGDAHDSTDSELSQSPTLTRQGTQVGVILGTAAYMSPEQAKGKRLDKRTDIFSFGAVLYEMLTGRRPFDGDSANDILGSVLKLQPNWDALPTGLSATIDKLLRRCLVKDAQRRLRDIGDARNEIEEILAEPAGAFPQQPLAVSAPSRALERVVWGLAILVASITVWNVMRDEPPAQIITRFPLMLPPGDALSGLGRHVVALSPDGTRFVYCANNQLHLREMDQLEAAPIRGTDMAREPFFSPDGQSLGFWADGQLKKISVTGGAALTLCEAGQLFGASWGADDTIVFGQGRAGILRVSAAGGTPEVLIPMDSDKLESGHGPQMLPDGKTVLFTLSTTGSWDESRIVTQSLETGERRVQIEVGSDARYVPTGHLVYALGETLLAVPFDPMRLEVTGSAVPVVEGVARTPGQTGAAQASFSDSGSLVYVPDGAPAAGRRLVWVDREGREEVLAAEPRGYDSPRISPDGSQVALRLWDQERDIWIWDFTRETLRRLTFDPSNDEYPTWAPGGRRLAFSSARGGGSDNLFWKAADGTGTVERITESENNLNPYVFSPDGKQLVYREIHPQTGDDLGVLSLDGDGSLKPLLVTEFNERNADISPDGRWMAYESDFSEQFEIYVRPFPNVDEGPFQISRGGGSEPLWARDGNELFYLDPGGRLMSVSVRIDPSLDFGNPEVVLEESYFAPVYAGRTYDVSPNGERFLMIKMGAAGDEAPSPDLILVINWFEELKRLVFTDN